MMNIAAVVYSYYPNDVRPRREAEAMVEAGMSVDIICLRKEHQPAKETINGVHVHRIPMRKIRAGRLDYIFQYLGFIIWSFCRLALLHFHKKFDVVHVHNMPDMLVFAALIPKLGGSGVLLDLHDPMPEVYMTKYSIRENHFAIRLLKLLERLSIRFSDCVITPNIAFRNRFVSRGCPEDKISIVMNSPMETVFGSNEKCNPPAEHQDQERLVLMYHGSVFERHGLDTALEAMTILLKKIPNLQLKVFGTGEYTEQFLSLVTVHHLQDCVQYHGFLPLEEIVNQIRSTDVGIIPNKMSPFTNINFPVRIFEYICMGKPAVVPRTEGILDYFDEDSLFFFEPGNAESLAQAILSLLSDTVRRNETIQRGFEVYSKYRWELQKKHLVELVSMFEKRFPINS